MTIPYSDSEIEALMNQEPLPEGYPSDWPRCPSCGRPAMDGHITCGRAECDEGEHRREGFTEFSENETAFEKIKRIMEENKTD